jgi:hypothetical protein
MRIRTILAAAAAPAALAAVLLGTAGQASAQVVSQPTSAVLTASVQSQKVTAVTHQNGVEDTTSGTATSYTDPNYGPVWAYDNVTKQFDITQTSRDHYTIIEAVHGSFTAFSSPNTGDQVNNKQINVTGSIDGTNTFYVISSAAPNPALLPSQSPAAIHTGDMISALFGGQQPSTDTSYLDSNGQPSSGNLWVFTYKAHGQTMTQRYDQPSSAWGNITG